MRNGRLATLGLALAISVGLALPASAEKPEDIVDHQSCREFGHFFRDWAQGGAEEFGFKNGGQGIKATAHDGLPGIATPPGSVAQVIHWEHSLFCDSD